jgi:hypothetical protein
MPMKSIRDGIVYRVKLHPNQQEALREFGPPSSCRISRHDSVSHPPRSRRRADFVFHSKSRSWHRPHYYLSQCARSGAVIGRLDDDLAPLVDVESRTWDRAVVSEHADLGIVDPLANRRDLNLMDLAVPEAHDLGRCRLRHPLLAVLNRSSRFRWFIGGSSSVVLVDHGVAFAAGDHVAVGQKREGVGDHETGRDAGIDQWLIDAGLHRARD